MKLRQTLNVGENSEHISDEDMIKRKCDRYNQDAGSLNIVDGYNCPICKNKGFIAKAEKTQFGYWAEIHYKCECQRIRENLMRLKKSGLEHILDKYTFEGYVAGEQWQKNIKNLALTFTENNNPWFFIGGASGCGKTHICTAICGKYLKESKDVRYMLWRDEIEKLKASKMDSEEYSQLMDKFKNAEVLYIDDLFKTGKASDNRLQKPTASDVSTAFELLNYRYNNDELITIISSECLLSDITDIDEAIGGRIIEKCGMYALNIKADRKKNYRLRGM